MDLSDRQLVWAFVGVIAVLLYLGMKPFRRGSMDGGYIRKYGFYVILLSAILDLIERGRKFWSKKQIVDKAD